MQSPHISLRVMAIHEMLLVLDASLTDEVRPALNNMELDCNNTLDRFRAEMMRHKDSFIAEDLQTKYALERTTEALEQAVQRIAKLERKLKRVISNLSSVYARQDQLHNNERLNSEYLHKEQKNIKQRLRDLEEVADWSNTEDQDHLEELMEEH